MDNRKLSDWLTSYMEYTNNSEPPPIYRQWVGISVIASVLQRKCFVTWEESIYPNMYIVLTGPSGKCRKGTAMRQGLPFITERGMKLAANSTTRESLIKQLRMSIDPHTDSEGRLQMHCSMTIFSEELTVFLGFNNKQLISDLTEWYDCAKRWKYETKHQGIDNIVNVWVNMIGATTPELVQATMPREAVGGGLTSRMIFVYAHRKGKVVVYPIRTPEELELGKLLSIDLESISMLSGEFIPSTKFLERYAPWYEDLENNVPFTDVRFSGYMERRATHLRKLSMILSASRSDDKIIREQDFDTALRILQSTERDMSRAFGGAGRAETSDVLFSVWTMIANSGQTTYSEILSAFRYDVSHDELQKILTTLNIMKEITSENIKGTQDYMITYIGTKKLIKGRNNE